ncbi:MAG TPA: hypothetical protein VGR21_02895 [Cryptosporangiaceae bacterium]|nr:hypothetical protein [Cryptosporangiaceae bacterium]
MDAAEIVSGLRRGDPAAAAAAYDQYAQRLYGYCSVLLAHAAADPEAPAVALRTAFLSARTTDRPVSPPRLAPWLYALCRREAGLLQARVPERPTGPLPVLPTAASAAPAAAVVSRLERDGREMIELAYRHGLTPAEVAAVIGIPEPLAASRLATAQADFAHLYTQLIGPDWSGGLASYGRSPLPELPGGLRAEVLAAVQAAAVSFPRPPGNAVALRVSDDGGTDIRAGVPPLPPAAPLEVARSSEPLVRRRSVLIAGVAVVAVLLGGGAVATVLRSPTEPGERTAVTEPAVLPPPLAGSGAPAPTTAVPKPSASPSPKRVRRSPSVRPVPTRKPPPAPRVSISLRKMSTACTSSWQARIAATVVGHPVRSVTISYWWRGYEASRLAAPYGGGQYILKPAGLPYNTVISYQAQVTRTDGRLVQSAVRTVRQPPC